MSNHVQSSAEAQQVQILTIVWAAQLAGPIVFAALAFALVNSGRAPEDTGLTLLIPLAQVLAIAAPLVGWYVGGLVAAPKKGETRSAVEVMRTGQIVAGAIGEGGAIFAIVVYLVTGETLLLAALLPMLFLFLSIRPTRDRLAVLRRRIENLRSPGAR